MKSLKLTTAVLFVLSSIVFMGCKSSDLYEYDEEELVTELEPVIAAEQEVKPEWKITYTLLEASKQLLPDEKIEEQFYREHIPAEYADAFLYYSEGSRVAMRPYFYALMVHESSNFTGFKHTNKDGSVDYGPSQLNSNNIKNPKFRKWYNPKDESHITSKYCFYMVMTMNYYWDLVSKYGFDYAFFAYNGGERTIKMIKTGSSNNSSLIKTVKTYDASIRSIMAKVEVERQDYINTCRSDHIESLLVAYHKVNEFNVKHSKMLSNRSLNKTCDSIHNNFVCCLRREDLLQFKIEENGIESETIVGTLKIKC